MLKRIYLHGEAATLFGPEFLLDVGSLKDVAQALGVQLKGFREYIADHDFRVVAGKALDDGMELGNEQISFNVGARDIHIVPVVKGASSKRPGVGKIIAGVLLAVVAWWAMPALGLAGGITAFGFPITTGGVAMMGVSMALAGASQLLTPKPKKQQSTTVEQKPSFVFNGAVNTTEQGGCVPLIYGRTMVGSTVISAGLTTDDIAV